MQIPRVGLRSKLKTKKKIKCLQVAVYMSARVQALTALGGDLVRTVNDISRAAQLMSQCGRNLYQSIGTWYQLGCPGLSRTCVGAADITHHIMLLHQRLRASHLYFGAPVTALNTSA